MFRFLLVTFVFAVVYAGVLPDVPQRATDWVRNGKIVGGEDADIRDAPYQVAMLYSRAGSTFLQSCGGSIINTTIIICAAHCAEGTTPSQWKVRAGSTISTSGGQLMDVSKIVIHLSFTSYNLDYDVSLYILSSSIIIDDITTKLIPLPIQDAKVDDNSLAFVTGWGSTREGGNTVTNLQKVIIPIVNQENCTDAYVGYNPVSDRMICAGNLEIGGQDACVGDSGGPLTIDGILIGVTSWGIGCGRPEYPRVWSRIPFFRTWIDQIQNETSYL